MTDTPARRLWIAECVAQVLDRLQQRRHTELSIGLPQLADQWSVAVAARYARLRIQQTTPAFWRQLTSGQDEDAAVGALRQAWHYGLTVTLVIDPACFGLLPVAGLAALPLRFCASDGLPVHLLACRVAGYRDVASLAPGYLVVARTLLLTALARDELSKRRLQLFRQV